MSLLRPVDFAVRHLGGAAGAYTGVFTQGCVIENEDRLRLAGVLEDLSEQIGRVGWAAEREKERLTALAAWEEREAQRKREFAAGDPMAGFNTAFTDPSPSPYRIPPEPICAACWIGERPRTLGRGPFGDLPGGRTSADPGRLRWFAQLARRTDAQLADMFCQLRDAWARFLSECSCLSVLLGGDRHRDVPEQFRAVPRREQRRRRLGGADRGPVRERRQRLPVECGPGADRGLPPRRHRDQPAGWVCSNG